MLKSEEIIARITRYGCCALTEMAESIDALTYGDNRCAEKHKKTSSYLTWAQGIMCGTVTDINPDGCYSIDYATRIAKLADCYCDCGCGGSTDPCIIIPNYTVIGTATVSERATIQASAAVGDSYLIIDPAATTDGTWSGNTITTWDGLVWTSVPFAQGEVASAGGTYWVTTGDTPGLMYPTVTTVFAGAPVSFTVVSDYPAISSTMEGAAMIQILTPSSTVGGLEWVTVLTVASSVLATPQTIGLNGFPAVSVRVVYTDLNGCVGISGNGTIEPPPSCIIVPDYIIDPDGIPGTIQVGDIVQINGIGNNQFYMWDGIELDAMFPPVTYGSTGASFGLTVASPNNLNTTPGTVIVELLINGVWSTVFQGTNLQLFTDPVIGPIQGNITALRTTYIRGICTYIVDGIIDPAPQVFTLEVCETGMPQIVSLNWTNQDPALPSTYQVLQILNPTGNGFAAAFLPGSLYDVITVGNSGNLYLYDPDISGSQIASIIVPGVPGQTEVDLFASVFPPIAGPTPLVMTLYAQVSTAGPFRTYSNGGFSTPARIIFECNDGGRIQGIIGDVALDCDTGVATVQVAATNDFASTGVVNIRYSLDYMVTWINYPTPIPWDTVVDVGPFSPGNVVFFEFSASDAVAPPGYVLYPAVIPYCPCVPITGAIGLKFRDVIDLANLPDPAGAEYFGGYVFIESDDTNIGTFPVGTWLQSQNLSGPYVWATSNSTETGVVVWVGVDERAWYMPPGPAIGPLSDPEPYALSVTLTNNVITAIERSVYVETRNAPYRIEVLSNGVWIPVWTGFEEEVFGMNTNFQLTISVTSPITSIRGVVNYDTCPIYVIGTIA